MRVPTNALKILGFATALAAGITWPMPLLAEGPSASFTIISCQGEVVYVPDGKEEPQAVQTQQTLSGGRFITLDEGRAEIKFPGGKSYSVPPNTLLMLDPKFDSLDSACAAAAAIRDRTVIFVKPEENASILSGTPMSVMLGVQMDSSAVKEAERLALIASREDDSGKSREVELQKLPTAEGKSPIGSMGYRFLRVTSNAPLEPGEYTLYVKAFNGAGNKKIGKDRVINVVKPKP